jgi:hypothetical protein
MGQRSTILTRLPRELRKELEKRLVEKSFSGYEDLTLWLNGQGYRISRGALNRYGIQFERRLEAVAAATAQAREFAEAAADDEGMTTEALVRLVQQRLFSVLIETERPLGQIDLARLARTISELSHTTITHRRWLAEGQDRLAQQRRAATGKLSTLEGEGGLSPATVQYMRDLLMSIDPFATPATTSDVSSQRNFPLCHPERTRLARESKDLAVSYARSPH